MNKKGKLANDKYINRGCFFGRNRKVANNW